MKHPRRTVAFAAALLLKASCGLAAPLKVATWNLDWLTTRPQGDPSLPADVQVRAPGDFALLRGYANHLDADIVAFEEVDGPQAAARVFDPARYTIVTIDEPVVQRVGIAVRHGIEILRHADLPALDVEPDAPHPLRDGLDATLRLPGGAILRLLAVHLKTGCHESPLQASRKNACRLLARQVPVIAAWVAARQAEAVPFLLLGDFNRVMDTPEALSDAIERAAPLLRATQGASDPCWGGDSFIDHIFLGGAARAWLVPDSLRVMVYSQTGEAWRERLSDHCAVSVRLDSR